MSDDQIRDEAATFGEQLIGMQGFSATLARRYRTELEKLLVHRITSFERWAIGACAILIAGTLIIFGAMMALAKDRNPNAALGEARLAAAATCAMTGLLLGGWMLRIAIQGGYGRRIGDYMGVFIALLFCGGWGFAFINMAWEAGDAIVRTKLLLGGGTLIAVMTSCIVIAHFQQLHRQTQEKLLRIEYHLAELMDRTADSPPG